MSAERLREAAALMRERAARATPGPWRPESSGPTGPVVLDAESTNALDHVAKCGHYRHHSDAAHIASWYPAVALAVADWLEATTCALHCAPDGKRAPYCSRCEDSGDDHECPPREVCTHSSGFREALAVADAYLGGAS